ncbi:hypothetical protein [Streptomyces sp. NPDC045470]|uniref:hypothetical protein n=1 Tax=Streptomyces sp. NPDC045470 TaxID=3155469 RepID=UPI0033F8C37C
MNEPRQYDVGWTDENHPKIVIAQPGHDAMTQAEAQQAVGLTYRVAALGEVSSVPVLRTVWLEEHNRKADA